MTYDRLKGIARFSDATITESLERNLISFFDWGLLNIGAFVNVRIPTAGLYGGNNHILAKVKDPNYTDGRVWQGFRKNWVWESGVSWNPAPIEISGVYVNGIFQPATGIGAYAHKIDYPNGRVIFNSAISTTAQVSCEYSYKIVSIINADDNWMRDAQFNSFDSSDTMFSKASGNWQQLPQNRIQFPAVGIQIPDRNTWAGKELGGGSWLFQDIIIYVLAESDSQRDKITDIFRYQKDKTILLYDVNRISKEGKAPLNYDGSINSAGIRKYSDMITDQNSGGYYYKHSYCTNTSVQSSTSYNPKLYPSIIKMSLQVSMPEI